MHSAVITLENRFGHSACCIEDMRNSPTTPPDLILPTPPVTAQGVGGAFRRPEMLASETPAFAHPELHPPEDFLTSEKALFFSDYSYYGEELRAACTEFGIPLANSSLRRRAPDFWVRDNYVINYQHNYLVPKRENSFLTAENFPIDDDNDIAGLHQRWSAEWSQDSRLYYRLAGRLASPDLHMRARSPFLKLGSRLRETSMDLEGGNLIQAVNGRGEVKAIVGLNGQLNTGFMMAATGQGDLAEHYIVERQIRDIDRYFSKVNGRIESGLSFLAAKPMIEKELGLEKGGVVVVPQWTYHIDCMMTYLGFNTFLVHSFDETIQHINELGIPPALLSSVLYTAKIGSSKFEREVIDKIIYKLTKHGFRAIKCAGVVFHRFYNPTDRVPRFDAFKRTDFCGANFMNGIAGSDRSGKPFYLTNDSALRGAKQYFSTLVARYIPNMDVRYLKVRNLDIADLIAMKAPGRSPLFAESYHTLLAAGYFNDTMAMMSIMGGGLRCQTNYLYPRVK